MALPIPKRSLHAGNVFETVVSGLVVVVAICFLVFIFVRTGTGHLGSYPVRIRLADAGGLSVGSEVRLGGTKIGSVSNLWLDQSDYSAVVEVQIRDDLTLPVDSAVSVSSPALGDMFLAISPGHSDHKVPADGELGSKRARRAATKPHG